MNKSNQSSCHPSSGQQIRQLIDYRIIETIYSGSRTLVYRAIRICDQEPVVIKLLKNDYPTFNELVQFRNQYTIAKNLDSPLIIQAYSLDLCQNGYALVMEDFGGTSLKDYFSKNQSFTCLKEFLILSITLCDILDLLYQERIIHKDIKPANILIHPETKQVKLIDFSIASLLPRETQEIKNANALEGTLAYISPEQTGRMNRGIDYRTDFYSLGVTFYELLTGELPFQSNDPMELIHAHIAKLAPLVHEVNPEIPLVLSAIVMKLMAKNAEDRYQSALGLKFDLEKCLTQLQETGEIQGFVIGERDESDRFIIPDKLYGRETEVETLLKAFDRVSLGATEMMLVAGFSGIGKTAIVNEVHKPIVRQRGYFIKGKFDQFNRDIPLSAFVQSFRGLMGQLLSESDVSLQLWKQKILAAVGNSGQVIIEVIPELELVIDCQPPVPELSGTAAQNRFNFLFQKFIQIFTTIEHPLVMFLDDLQWADLASLNLIQVLMAESTTGYLLLLGAYRDNEVLAGHPLILTLDAINQAGAKVNTITLEPLSQSSLNQLIADTLHCAIPLAQPLTELVIQKTQGNPFFTTQFLKALHQEKLITFDTNAGYWQCDIVRVWDTTLTDNVVEFMALQLQKLPDTTQNILKLAACIGAQFDLQTLSIVSEQSPTEAATALWKALQEGLILPQSEIYKFYLEETELDKTVNHKLLNYKFLHDRIQQAAYSLITHEHKQLTHLSIGQLLLQNTPVEQIENHLFEIVNHLNKGVGLIMDQAKQLELVNLNLMAGNKAKSATAYTTALNYFTFGIELLPPNHWHNQSNLTLDLYIAATEAAYLSTNFAEIDQFAQEVIQNSRSLIDQIKVYEIKILASSAQNQLQQSVETGLWILGLLGVSFPKEPNQADIQQGLAEVSANLTQIEIEDLIKLPVMEDSQALAAMDILSSIAPAVFRVLPTLYPLIVFKQVNLSIAYGNGPLSAFAYIGYGLILCSVLQDIDAGYQFGQLANHLLIKSDIKQLKAKINSINGGYIIHWKQHLKTVLPILQEGYKNGLEMGELEFTSYCAFFYGSTLYYTGHDLEQTKNNLANYSAVIHDLKQENPLCWNKIYHQTVLNLMGQSIDVYRLQGDACDEDQLIPMLLKSGDKLGLHLFYSNKFILAYLFENYSLALDHAHQAELYLDGVLGMFAVPIFYFYDSLVHLAAASTISTTKISTQHEWLLRTDQNQAKLKEWAIYAPMNFLNKYDLVEAERCRILDEKVLAIDFYDRAIAGAKANEYIQEEALANELAAKFYLSWGKPHIAQGYMTEAYYSYARWGAKAKVADLESHYPQLLAPILSKTPNLYPTNKTIFSLETFNSSSTDTAISNNNFSVALDLASILKASQALSSEIRLDKLLATVLEVVIETAGADKCVLILEQDERLLIKGTITVNAEPVVLQNILIEDSTEIPLKLIYKVKRNQQTIVLIDATTDLTLATDSYIINQQPKSILCSPILHQGKLLGILYLENNLALGAFTSDRVELLNLICTQAAISLENARLYEREQQKSQALEKALNDLQNTQLQLVQGEKMSALGNLVAGVAHEMNNPLGFISASLKQAQPILDDIFDHLKLYQENFPNKSEEIIEHESEIDLEYSLEDLPKMIDSMTMACDRLKNISTSLRTFSRADQDYKVPFYLYEGIDSTILILKHRLKANDLRPAIEVVTNYGELPPIQCFPGQLNQVFMNILANAIDALEESNQGRSFAEIQANPNKIVITTKLVDTHVQISIVDNGKGISEAVKDKVFDHLFTTKEVGKGTGLGLAIARQIVEEKHGGFIQLNSTLEEGTEFIIALPAKAA